MNAGYETPSFTSTTAYTSDRAGNETPGKDLLWRPREPTSRALLSAPVAFTTLLEVRLRDRSTVLESKPADEGRT